MNLVSAKSKSEEATAQQQSTTKANRSVAESGSGQDDNKKFNAYVKEMYIESVRKITSCLKRKGVYCVTMEWTGVVLSVKKCKLSTPGPNQFFIIVFSCTIHCIF